MNPQPEKPNQQSEAKVTVKRPPVTQVLTGVFLVGMILFMIGYITLGIINLLPPQETLVTTYYVNVSNPACNDTGAGSQAVPWCSLQKAADTVNPGDTVLVADGVYRGQAYFNRSGTATSPITFRAIGNGAILTRGEPLNESLFVKTPGYQHLYEIAKAQLPGQTFNGSDNLAQLDQTSAYTGWRYEGFAARGGLSLVQNQARKVSSITEVEANPYTVYFDGNKLYVHTRDGSAAGGHELELVRNADEMRYLVFESNIGNLAFDGFKFRYASMYYDINMSSAGYRGGQNNITFQNVEFIGAGINLGVVWTNSETHATDNIKFQNCSIHDTMPGSNGGANYSGDTAIVVNNSANGKIVNCLVRRVTHGIDLGASDANPTNTLFDRVLVTDFNGHPYYDILSTGTTLTNSIIALGSHGEGPYLNGSANMQIINSMLDGVLFQKNPIRNCAIANNLTIKDNVFAGGFGLLIDPACASSNWGDLHLVSDSNLYLPHNTGADCDPNNPTHACDPRLAYNQTGTPFNLAGWQTASGGQDMHSLIANATPLWLDWQNGNFHPAAGAQLIDAGVTVANGHDYDNANRPQGVTHDMGAYEYAAAQPQNHPPVLTPIGAKATNVNQALTFSLTATDADMSDVLTFTLTNYPAGATLIDNGNGTATFSWTPTSAQVGTYAIHIQVSDGIATDSEDITITVNSVNQPPVLAPIGAKTTGAGQPLTFTVSATDPDASNTLTFSLTNGPTGATLTNGGNRTATFNWTPTADQAGTHANVHFQVSDGIATDSEDITITVTPANRVPVLAPIGNRSIRPKKTLQFTVTATDPDAGNHLTLSAFVLPTGASFTDRGNGTGVFSWRPTQAQLGQYPVSFVVSDGQLTDTETVTITVKGINSILDLFSSDN